MKLEAGLYKAPCTLTIPAPAFVKGNNRGLLGIKTWLCSGKQCTHLFIAVLLLRPIMPLEICGFWGVSQQTEDEG